MVFGVDALTKAYGTTAALDRVSFTVDEGEIVSIIGPSGAGKTTLLRILAGLETPTSGHVVFTNPPSRSRPIVLVFQDYVLFPHLTVFENVAYGLRARRNIPRRDVRFRVNKMLAYFDIDDKSEEYPARLSGGQKQRVAIARAMVLSPFVLLLDEPFAHLDKNLKSGTAEFIRRTQKSFGTTTVTVTHDLEEAFAMSDKIGILLDGALRQYDSVDQVYAAPSSPEVARFLGPVNDIPAELVERLCPRTKPPPHVNRVYSRAESLEITNEKSAAAAVVTAIRFNGMAVLYDLGFEGVSLKAYSLTSEYRIGQIVRIRLRDCFWHGKEKSQNAAS